MTLAQVWDGLSLGLVGILYSVVVTVIGVLVAPYGFWWRFLYGVLALGLLIPLWYWQENIVPVAQGLLRRRKVTRIR